MVVIYVHHHIFACESLLVFAPGYQSSCPSSILRTGHIGASTILVPRPVITHVFTFMRVSQAMMLSTSMPLGVLHESACAVQRHAPPCVSYRHYDWNCYAPKEHPAVQQDLTFSSPSSSIITSGIGYVCALKRNVG